MVFKYMYQNYLLYQKQDKFIHLCKLAKSNWQLAKGLTNITFTNCQLNSVGVFYPVGGLNHN
jgi:hypothetical protein